MKTVDVAVFACQYDGTTRSANRIGDEAILKQHSFGGESINIRRLVDDRAISTDGLVSMIIREYKDYVGTTALFLGCFSEN